MKVALFKCDQVRTFSNVCTIQCLNKGVESVEYSGNGSGTQPIVQRSVDSNVSRSLQRKTPATCRSNIYCSRFKNVFT